MESTENRKGVERLPAIMLLLAPVILYLSTLNHYGFWVDEFYTLDAAGRTFIDMLANRLKAGHGPVYFTLLWFWARLFGESEISLRLPALLGGLAAAGVTGWVLWCHGRRLAVTCATLVLLNAALFEFSRMARMYTLVALVVLLAAGWALAHEERPDRRAVLVLAVLTALALHLHYSATLYVGGLAAYLLFRTRPAWRLLAGLGLGALTLLPWGIVFLLYRSPIDPVAWLPAARPESVVTYPATLAYPYWNKVIAWPLALAAGLLIAGLAWRGRRALGDTGCLLTWFWLLPWPAMIGLMMLGVGDILTVHRYFLVAAIAQLVLTTAGILSLRRGWPAFATAALAAWIALHVLGLGHFLTVYPAPDWRAAARYIAASGEGAAPVLLLVKFEEPFRHYYEAGAIITYDDITPGRGEDPGHLRGGIPPPPETPLWIVISRRAYGRWAREQAGRWTPDQLMGEWLATTSLQSAVEVGDLRILRLESGRRSPVPE